MNKWELFFVNVVGGGLIGATITNWDMWPYSLPAFALVVIWGAYLEKTNDKENSGS